MRLNKSWGSTAGRVRCRLWYIQRRWWTFFVASGIVTARQVVLFIIQTVLTAHSKLQAPKRLFTFYMTWKTNSTRRLIVAMRGSLSHSPKRSKRRNDYPTGQLLLSLDSTRWQINRIKHERLAVFAKKPPSFERKKEKTTKTTQLPTKRFSSPPAAVDDESQFWAIFANEKAFIMSREYGDKTSGRYRQQWASSSDLIR